MGSIIPIIESFDDLAITEGQAQNAWSTPGEAAFDFRSKSKTSFLH
jgi:hypothetical protein